ncbi:MAG: glycosyltransferase [Candidatus Lokiarchaeota archaeon]|nr:glycosyltransferase [Candidatus Lokiarchaeota archaeon]
MNFMSLNSKSILEAYASILDQKVIDKLKKKAAKFKNKSVLHVNATKFGGGVAEILQNMVPLMNELAIEAVWKTFSAPDSFFEISKKMHNALQGNREIHFTDKEVSDYFEQAKSSYDQIKPDSDFNIIHDPQPCPMIKSAEDKIGKWIWRCHIDTANPNPQAWHMISDSLSRYDALIFTKLEYAEKAPHDLIYQIPPSINPFSLKNKDLPESQAQEIVKKYVPLDLPIVTQVSRFDPWKDPLGVIDAYRIVKEKNPIRLVLIGSLAHDDPEGVEWLKKVKDYAKNDPNIIILSNLDGVGDIEVNAFQRLSTVLLQKSIKEGFGLTVTEGMWKKTPVIGGNVGGIKLQIDDGVNGFLVDTIEQTAEKILYLLKNPKKAKQMGEAGHLKIKNEFLLIKHVERYLDLFETLTK